MSKLRTKTVTSRFLNQHRKKIMIYKIIILVTVIIAVLQLARPFKINYEKEKDKFIDFQSEILHKLRGQLEKTSYTMEEQGVIIRQLIQYLKNIKHWPPKIEPIDPDSIARARSEA